MTDAAQNETALCITCLIDQFRPSVGWATVRLLEACGRRVVFPEAQTCCGQPAFNTGDRDVAREVARRTVEIFERYDEVVAPSGSCVSMLRVHYPELLQDDPSWHERAQALASRVFELTEFLDAQSYDPSGSTFRGKVVVHDSCHLLRELGVREAPRALLRRVPGVEIVEMEHAQTCCGFGGAFSVKMSELSSAMLDDKLRAATAVSADYLVAADFGCLMHLDGGLRRRGDDLRVLHVAEILSPEPAT